MNFNTALFLFLFLPFFLVMYFVAQPKWRTWVGLAGSLLFYAWGQVFYIPLIAAIVLLNFWIGSQLRRDDENKTRTRVFLYTGILLNVGLLAFFKLLSTYGVGMFGSLAGFLPERADGWLRSLVFPLGLSYISFQVTSYLIDVANGRVKPEGNLVNFALYVFLFPKLLAGPIVRYASVAAQLSEPAPTRELSADGVRRFIQGLAKKVLIADVLANLVNAVFNQPSPSVIPGIAWLALIAYALQIYFDFSGYTDMAIGLGMLMGFRFMENFNYPYISQSIGDFWRRWHISLSSWFRDYVFYPLERRRIPVIGQPLNILIVFLLTGLWHGVTVMFVAWGLLHGILLVLEALFLGRWLQRAFRPVRHIYALAAILLTWLVFRSSSPAFAIEYLGRLAGNSQGVTPVVFTQAAPLPFIEPSFWLAFAFAVFFCLPVRPWLETLLRRATQNSDGLRFSFIVIGDLSLLVLLILSVGLMTSSKFLPGIYGSF